MAFDLIARLKLHDDFTAKLRKAAGGAKEFKGVMDETAGSSDMLSRAAGRSSSVMSRVFTSITKSAVRASGAVAGVGDGATSASNGLASAAGTGNRFVRETGRIRSAVDRLGSTFDGFRKKASIPIPIPSMSGIAGSIAGLGVGYGAYKTTSSALKLASDAEMANIAFETMLGSAEKAQSFQLDLKNYAADSPFDIAGLRDSSRQMLGFGFAVDGVIPMLRNFSDASAGLGLGTDGIKRMTYAFGQMKAKGKIAGDEILQLAEMGVPAIQMLADKMHVSQAAVIDMTSKGLIPADKAIRTLLDGLDKRFGGLSDKQSKTLTGMYNKMQDTFENDILIRWGQGISTALEPRFKRITKWIDENDATIQRWGRNIADVASRASDALLRKVEGAYKYVEKTYLNNPKFQKLSASGQVSFIISDVLDLFNKWLKGPGGQQIKNVTESLAETIGASIEVAGKPVFDAAIKMGSTLGDGIIVGFEKLIADHPFLSAVIGAGAGASFGSKLGPYGALAGGLVGMAGGLIASHGADDAISRRQLLDAINDPNSPINRAKNAQSLPAGVSGTPIPSLTVADTEAAAVPTAEDGGISVNLSRATSVWDSAPKKAGGLDRVPYNGYRTILHKDERVQTKAEADAARNGGSGLTRGNGPLVTVQNMTVRKESDIDDIARSLAREIMSLQGVVTP